MIHYAPDRNTNRTACNQQARPNTTRYAERVTCPDCKREIVADCITADFEAESHARID